MTGLREWTQGGRGGTLAARSMPSVVARSQSGRARADIV
jgi:hypothetical protein